MGATDRRHGLGDAVEESELGGVIVVIFPDVEWTTHIKEFGIGLHRQIALADAA